MGSGVRIPGRIEFPGELAETCGDQRVLRGEVAIESHLVGAGRLGDRVHPNDMDASAIEQLASSREDALTWGSATTPRMSDGLRG